MSQNVIFYVSSTALEYVENSSGLLIPNDAEVSSRPQDIHLEIYEHIHYHMKLIKQKYPQQLVFST